MFHTECQTKKKKKNCSGKGMKLIKNLDSEQQQKSGSE